MTNHHWSFSIEAVCSQFSLKSLVVVNDFTALASSLPYLAAENKHQIGGGVVRDSNTTIDHTDDKRYNIAPSLTWNIDPDTTLTFLSQFNRDDTGTTSQFLPIQGTLVSTPAGKVKPHKNLGDPSWEFYDKTYYALG